MFNESLFAKTERVRESKKGDETGDISTKWRTCCQVILDGGNLRRVKLEKERVRCQVRERWKRVSVHLCVRDGNA